MPRGVRHLGTILRRWASVRGAATTLLPAVTAAPRGDGEQFRERRVDMVIVTITHVTDDDQDSVFVDATCEDGSDVPLTEALGMIELAKAVLMEQAS